MDCCFKTEKMCTALNTKECFGIDKCAFFKTAEQNAKDREKSNERLRGIDIKKQEYIAKKYYGNRKVWLTK